MRWKLSLLAWIVFSNAACAEEFSVEIKRERAFGYFVGDLVRAVVEIRGPVEGELLRSSLPQPASLSLSLDLREVSPTEEFVEGATRVWRLRLTYQNFYAALDVRSIEVPAFELSFEVSGARRLVSAPAWRFSVAPLREIVLERKESGQEYLRPDPGVDFVDGSPTFWLAFSSAALSALLCIMVAWDRGWAPFHRRSSRVFAGAARKLEALRRRRDAIEATPQAMRELHRAFDAAAGKRILAGDLEEFFLSRPEFDRQRCTTERFYSVSEKMFFGGEKGPRCAEVSLSELIAFAKALAQRERAG
ncbi:nonribosomal peptide synthetase MxaA [Methylocystis heyeri]|uniref:Nonribosomal peptide synthetase MxaA n=1 Tax=Methylocystis heyeri TaxID=391905 RepID=A0A6B8KHP2_9HYPH|nr:nonribosomal peptide synthetase MxaA [Methylocystis heyeri]QGM46023.1 nonribosomal peptide synthetase MxaA [Methylocystis heyeri]